MIIVHEKEKTLSEGNATFIVDYWGTKVTYEIELTGREINITSKDAHAAARAISTKALITFRNALKKAGMGTARVSGFTAESFIPVGAIN
jgi:trans-2-enoyl-CoA reductase